MASVIPFRPSINDLWADAASQLSEADKGNLNFSNPDKRGITADLLALAQSSEQEAIKKRWKYTRKGRETVILRDVFAKIVHWVNVFKQVGDTAVQYDPGHAALPWAGVRFILQIAVNDFEKHASIIEELAQIAELICRFAIVENLYPLSGTNASQEMERALVKLYAAILLYLSKAKSYFDQGSAKRAITSVFVDKSQFESYLSAIRGAQEIVEQCMVLVNRHDQIENQDSLEDLLKHMSDPIARMDNALKDIRDNLEGSRRTKILCWLAPEPYMEHHNQVKKDVLPGTGKWLLDDQTFVSWKEESASSILWLRGIPGSGKSKLVSIVIDDAFRASKAGQCHAPAFFYSSRSSAESSRSDPRAILASIARQLSSLQEDLPILKPAIDVYQKREAVGFASGSLEIEESRDLIIKLVEYYPLTTIVIDALDECDPAKRAQLLEALEEILEKADNLIKVFVSSRNDQDITFELEHYPNLSVTSTRNGGDITTFVKSETKRLIQKKKLLRSIEQKGRLEELIIEKVCDGAAGMFRWASLQLQYLCTCKFEADIRDRLGRNPPDLDSLYADIYRMLSTAQAQFETGVFRNALSLLLCAQETLTIAGFLAAISVVPGRGYEQVSKDQVLEICNNFVIDDAELDTFRFTHLSVREFLEKRDEYSFSSTNALVAEICLLHLVCSATSPTAKEFLSSHDPNLLKKPPDLEPFEGYPMNFWPVHSRLAAHKKAFGSLKDVLWFFLSTEAEPEFPFNKWRNGQFVKYVYFPWQWLLKEQWEDARSSALYTACAFNFSEFLEDQGTTPFSRTNLVNSEGRSMLYIAVRHSNLDTIKFLLNREDSERNVTENVLKEAAANEDPNIMTMLLGKKDEDMGISDIVLASAAENRNHEVMKLLLDQCGNSIVITKEVLKTAAKNQNHEITEMLLDRCGNSIVITEEVLWVAAKSENHEVMKLLLDRCSSSMVITEAVLKTAAENQNHEIMKLLLDQWDNNAIATENVLKPAVEIANSESTKALLDQHHKRIQFHKVLTRAARNRNDEVMRLLLDRRGDDFQITEEILVSAASNRNNKVMTLLLDRRSKEIIVTEEVLVSAAGNSCHEIMTFLLSRRGHEIQITEKIVVAAARNDYCNEILRLLLHEQRGNEIHITERILLAAAANTQGEDIMKLLFDERKHETQITEKVLIAAAENDICGVNILTVLFYQLDDEVQITEKILIAAVGNRRHGVKILTLIFDRLGDKVQITEKVLIAAMGNGECGVEILTLLFDRLASEIRITEKVLIAAAGKETRGVKILTLFFDQRDTEFQIKENILIAAAANERCGAEILTMLFNRLSDEVRITEKILITAATNERCGSRIMTLLLDPQLDVEPIVTERLLEKAATNPKQGEGILRLLLDRQRGNEVEITETILMAVAANHGCGLDIMTLLLDVSSLEITDKVLEKAAGNERWGQEILRLLLDRQRGNEVQITEKTLMAAADNYGCGLDIMTLLLDVSSLEITYKVLEEAAQNEVRGQKIVALIFDRRRGDELKITDKMLERVSAWWPHGRQIRKFLLGQRRGDMIRITDEVVDFLARDDSDPEWGDSEESDSNDDVSDGSESDGDDADGDDSDEGDSDENDSNGDDADESKFDGDDSNRSDTGESDAEVNDVEGPDAEGSRGAEESDADGPGPDRSD